MSQYLLDTSRYKQQKALVNMKSSNLLRFLEADVLNPKFIGKCLCLQASACNFIKKEAVAQVFSCEFCEIFKNTFFTEHLCATASDQCFPLFEKFRKSFDIWEYWYKNELQN